MDLIPPKTINLGKIRSWIDAYLVNFLLIPWIWVWGGYLMTTFFVWIYELNQNKERFSFSLRETFYTEINLRSVWLIITLLVLTNYTIAIGSKKIYPRLNYPLFWLSLVVVFFLFLLTWPHALLVLQSS